jgi:chaperonin cofactor prefoldin
MTTEELAKIVNYNADCFNELNKEFDTYKEFHQKRYKVLEDAVVRVNMRADRLSFQGKLITAIFIIIFICLIWVVTALKLANDNIKSRINWLEFEVKTLENSIPKDTVEWNDNWIIINDTINLPNP